MTRGVLIACWPWLVALAVLVLAAHFLLRLSNARLRLGRLRQLHGDQGGAVQSMSFVLTLPVFIMVMMLIVQISQLMIGMVVVQYAAYAAARSAAVWIPARLPAPEGENCISAYEVESDSESAGVGEVAGGMIYRIQPGSAKYNKIASAAVMACMPISPSRDLGFSAPNEAAAGDVLKTVYAAMASSSDSPAGDPNRLDHKLAYAWNNTTVEVRFYHKGEEPPLWTYGIPGTRPEDINDFCSNELGWQDVVTVTVKYDLALLPGPGRLLARYVVGPGVATDTVAASITNHGTYYSYPLTAQITMGIEGEKSQVPYVYQAN